MTQPDDCYPKQTESEFKRSPLVKKWVASLLRSASKDHQRDIAVKRLIEIFNNKLAYRKRLLVPHLLDLGDNDQFLSARQLELSVRTLIRECE